MKKIILCIDNSDPAFIASEAALKLAQAFEAEVVGVHAYNASMHQGAFTIMEPTLPAQYQKEDLLQKQRALHSSLINIGMEKISLSYLQPVEENFRKINIKFTPVVQEGKNFLVLQNIIAKEGSDLVVMGSSGFNENGRGFIGSVCLRVLRTVDANILVVKKPVNLINPRFVIGLDGSSSAVSALELARVLAAKCHGELHLIYVFDSKLHKTIFDRLKESLINSRIPPKTGKTHEKEGLTFSFNSKQQEKIHDQFIDRGLERVGEMILERAEKDSYKSLIWNRQPIEELHRPEDWVIRKRVLEGQIYKRICDYAAEVKADLIFLGRTGRHSSDGMNLGSVTENVVRFAPSSVVVARQAEYAGWQI